MPLERVPRAQKEITHRRASPAKPVIVATQVLESMTIERARTCAEVNDAANASRTASTRSCLRAKRPSAPARCAP
jgi:pyruvate kinase